MDKEEERDPYTAGLSTPRVGDDPVAERPAPELHRSPEPIPLKRISAKKKLRRPKRVALLMIDVAGSALAPNG